MYRHALLMVVSFFASGSPAWAWDGTDVESGTQVEIERGNLVRSGRDIEIYDSETGQYHDITIDDINRSGRTVEIQGHDNTTGEDRTFEFDDR